MNEKNTAAVEAEEVSFEIEIEEMEQIAAAGIAMGD